MNFCFIVGVCRPTIPQLYVSGEFVGGAEIVRQMFEANELQPMVKAAKKVCARTPLSHGRTTLTCLHLLHVALIISVILEVSLHCTAVRVMIQYTLFLDGHGTYMLKCVRVCD